MKHTHRNINHDMIDTYSASRRKEEIELHGHARRWTSVRKSLKKYNRKDKKWKTSILEEV